MKRLIQTFIRIQMVACMLAAFSGVASGATRNISLSTSSSRAGGVVEVPVVLDNASGLAGVRVQVNFDPSLLELESVRPGSLGALFDFSEGQHEGSVQILLVREDELPRGSGALAILKFHVNPGAEPGTFSSLAAAKVSLSDNAGVLDLNQIDTIKITNGMIAVGAPIPNAVTITSRPLAQTVDPGASVMFSVTAKGDGTLRYQWRRNGENIGAANSPSYTIGSVQEAAEGTYDVVVSNKAGSTISHGAVLKVNDAASITSNPASQSINAGSIVTFSVSATGPGILKYQWRKGASDIPMATGSSYTISSVSAAHAGDYSVVITSSLGSISSRSAHLNVIGPVVILAQPTLQTANPGTSATFNVSATGAGTLSYQWRKGTRVISHGTGPSLTITPLTQADEGSYSVVVTNSFGSMASVAAPLTINDPVKIAVQPTSKTVAVGAVASFAVSAIGKGTLTYQWRKGTVDIPNATHSSYTISPVTAADVGAYSVIVTNIVGSQISSSATLSLSQTGTAGPKLTLASPSGTVTGTGVLIKGTVTAAGGIARVEVSINNAAPILAAITGADTTRGWALTVDPTKEGSALVNGENTIQVRGFDLHGNASAKLSSKFTFAYLRPTLAGTYNGLLVPVEGLLSDGNRSALVSLTVTNTGRFSGSIQMAGVKTTLKGLFPISGPATFGATPSQYLELTKGTGANTADLGRLVLIMDQTGTPPKVTCQLTDGTTVNSTGSAEKAIYSASAPVASGMQRVPTNILDPQTENGNYTALFFPKVDDGFQTNNLVARSDFPQGQGYGIVKVSSSGAVSITGKLADGAIVSYSNQLSPNQEVPIYLPLYNAKGFVAGSLLFASQSTSDAACEDLAWFCPAGVPLSAYPAGWPNGISTSLRLSRYVAPTKASNSVHVPANPNTVLGKDVVGVVAPAINLAIRLLDGGLSSPTRNVASLSALNAVTLPLSTDTSKEIEGLKITFTPTTGAMSGTFIHPISKKATQFAGVAYQKTSSAGGFFLYQPLSKTGLDSAAQSGAVTVTAP